MTDTNRAEPYSRTNLLRWGQALQAEGNSIGESLIAYAEKWAAEVEASRLPLAGAATSWVRLADSDWVNIVNAKEVLREQDAGNPDIAINAAVRLTEARLRELNASPAPSDAAQQPVADSHARNLEGHVTTLLLSGRCDGMVEDMQKAARFLRAQAGQQPSDWLAQHRKLVTNLVFEIGDNLDEVKTNYETWCARVNKAASALNEHAALATSPLPTAPAGARMPEFPEPIGYESPVLKIIYTPDDNPEDKSLPVFSKEQVLALILAARAALAAAPGARQPLSDAEIDAMFSRWAIGTGDVKHMYRAGFRHAVRDLESEHGITLAPIAGKGDGNG